MAEQRYLDAEARNQKLGEQAQLRRSRRLFLAPALMVAIGLLFVGIMVMLIGMLLLFCADGICSWVRGQS